nr:MAG TPA: hypothetical protein [Caudoviricetes sp.]
MKEKATIFDYARMCKKYVTDCESCPLAAKLNGENMDCQTLVLDCPGKANETILKWCKEHPIKTRQSEFMKMFPNVSIYKGAINICPCAIDCDYDCKNKEKYVDFDCTGCKKAYWLAEVDK